MPTTRKTTFIVAISLVCITFYRLCSPVTDIDLWGYMSFGKLFWLGDSFPYHDPFSYVPKKDIWVYHEWLTGVVLYKIFDVFGETGLQLLRYAVGFSTAGFVYIAARLRGAERLPAAFGVFFASLAFGIGYSPVKAQIFTYFLFVLTVYILETARNKGYFRLLALLVPTQILWCNFHGGFIAGLGLTAIYSIGQITSRRRAVPFLVVTLASVISTLVNPYGVLYWFNILDAITMSRPFIAEWWSVLTAIKAGYALSNHFMFILLVALALLAVIKYKWKDVTDLLVLGVTAFLAFRSNRHEVFFILSFGIYLPVVFMPYINRLISDSKFTELVTRLNWKAATAILLCLITFPIYRISNHHPLHLELPSTPTAQSGFYYPNGAIKWIKESNLTGNILTDFEWGEFLTWELYPKCFVSMDGRYESVYPDDVFDEYIRFYFGLEGWRNFLDKYHHDIILIKREAKVYRLLRQEENWSETYSDLGSAIFLPCNR